MPNSDVHICCQVLWCSLKTKTEYLGQTWESIKPSILFLIMSIRYSHKTTKQEAEVIACLQQLDPIN